MIETTQPQTRRHLLLTASTLALALFLSPSLAFAGCSTPTGVAGDIIYNGTYNVLQYCNGTSWINAGALNASGGALTSGDFCNSNGSLISCTTPATGTGSVVLSASPTLTGSVNGASSVWSGTVSVGTTAATTALTVGGTVTATGFTGPGTGLTGIGTSNLTGITGTANNTTYLRGDGTWATGSGGAALSGGLANNFALWTSPTAIGTSAIYQVGSSVGIGTTVPAAQLHIGSGSQGLPSDLVGNVVIQSNNAAGYYSVLSLIGGTTGADAIHFGSSASVYKGTISYDLTANAMYFYANGSGNPNLAINSAGNVSIGTTSASTALQVNGTVTATSFAGAHTGSGSGLTGIGTSALGGITGSPSSTTYLRGDGTWASASGGALSSLNDVTLTSPATSNILQYNGSKWVNASLSTAMSTTTMIPNFPDAIICTNGGTTYVFPLASFIPGTYAYYPLPGSSSHYMEFNTSTGAVVAEAGTVTGSNCNGLSISQLYAAGLAYNYIGSSLTSAAAPAGGVQFNNGSGVLAGDTGFIWDNTNKRLGIGVGSPSTALQVSGTVTATSFAGSGASLTSIPVSALSATGTASSSTFLRGDGSWSAASGGLPALANGALWMGNASTVATAVTPSGDCTITNAGAITCTKTGGTAFGALATMAPTGTASSTTYLRGDGTWATVSAGGSGTVTSSTAGQLAYFPSTGTTVAGTSSINIAGMSNSGISNFTFGTNYATTGTQSDVPIGTAGTSIRYTGSGVATFNGISGGANGQILYLHNGSTSTLTLANKAAADTTVANQIVTGTGSNLNVAANSAVVLQYDSTATNSTSATGAWRVLGGSGSSGSNTGGWVNSGATVGNSLTFQAGTWQTLDLSSYVGANKTLVMLEVSNGAASGSATASFRTGSDTTASTSYGTSTCTQITSTCYLMVQTNASGIVDYESSAANSVTGANVTLVGFLAPSSSYAPNLWSQSGSSLYYTSGSVGIGTATPTASLSIGTSSTTGFQFATNYTTTGTQVDVPINTGTSVRYTGSGVATFNGIVAGSNGQVLYLHNGSTSALTLGNQSTAETTYANQIVTGTGAALSVAANSAVILQYDSTAANSNGASGAWRVIGGSGSASGSGGSSTVFSLIASTDITTATSSYTFSGLSGDTDVEYIINASIYSSASSNNYYLYFNGNTNNSSGYYSTFLQNGTASVSTIPYLYNGNATCTPCTGNVFVYAKSRTSAYPSAISQFGNGSSYLFNSTLTWNTANTQVTSLQIAAAGGNLGVGTHLELWALRTVGGSGGGGSTPAGATTQVQYNGGSSALAATSNFSFLSSTNALVVGTGAVTPVATAGTVATANVNFMPQSVAVTPLSTTGSATVNTAAIGQMAYYSGANAISGTNNLYVSGSNIGIGTTSATYDLSFGGGTQREIWMERAASGAGNNLKIQAGAGQATTANLNGGTLLLSGGISTGTGTSQIQFQTAPASTSGTGDNAPVTAMTVTGAGNIGIGTTVPNYHLSVNGNSSGNDGINIANAGSGNPQLSFDSPLGTIAAAITLNKAGAVSGHSNLLFWDGSANILNLYNGNVGIGTASPSYPVDIMRDSNALRLWSPNTGTVSQIFDVWGPADTTKRWTFTNNNGYFTVSTGSYAGTFGITGGNVGIGTTAPATTLAVHTGTDQNFEIWNGPNYGGPDGVAISSINDARNAYKSLTLNASKIILGAPGYAAGSVGIGTTLPLAPLHIDGTSNAGGNGWSAVFQESPSIAATAIGSRTAGAGYAGAIQGLTANLASASTLLVNPFGGGVAIGTTSLQTSTNLTVAGDNAVTTTFTSQVAISGLTAPARKLWLGYDTANNYGIVQATETNIANRALALNPWGGNVGIGTTTPQWALSVKSGGNQAYAQFLSSSASGASTSGVIVGENVSDGYLWNNDSGGMIFGTSNNERARISSGGALGIGNTAPTTKLTVGASTAGQTNWQVFLADQGTTSSTYGIVNRDSSNTDIFWTRDDGVVYVHNYLGINTPSPGDYLGINTSTDYGEISLAFPGATKFGGGFNNTDTGTQAQTTFNFLRNNTSVGSIYTTNTATTFATTSDRRLKENFTPTTRGLEALTHINVTDFNFIKDVTKKRVQGFIAQEVYKVYPEAVATNGDDGIKPLGKDAQPWSVDYGRLTPLLVKSIQELKADNDNLRAAHEADQKAIDELRASIAQIQKLLPAATQGNKEGGK